MKLYHISEEADIHIFKPRRPLRQDMTGFPPLVWAVNERCLPNFLTPRECPRVTYHIGKSTLKNDIQSFFSGSCKHVVAIETSWFKKIISTKLWLYEFSPDDFYLQDEVAGYYISEKVQKPIDIVEIENPVEELIKKAELRVVPDLEALAEKVQYTSLNWSFCRMRNLKK